jgi:hypothetical protein
MYNDKKKPTTNAAPNLTKEISIEAVIKPVAVVTLRNSV